MEHVELIGCFSWILICVTAFSQRQWKMQKDRFTDEFSNLLKDFQTVQREAVEKMRASVKRARAHSGINQVGKLPAGLDLPSFLVLKIRSSHLSD